MLQDLQARARTDDAFLGSVLHQHCLDPLIHALRQQQMLALGTHRATSQACWMPMRTQTTGPLPTTTLLIWTPPDAPRSVKRATPPSMSPGRVNNKRWPCKLHACTQEPGPLNGCLLRGFRQTLPASFGWAATESACKAWGPGNSLLKACQGRCTPHPKRQRGRSHLQMANSFQTRHCSLRHRVWNDSPGDFSICHSMQQSRLRILSACLIAPCLSHVRHRSVSMR